MVLKVRKTLSRSVILFRHIVSHCCSILSFDQFTEHSACGGLGRVRLANTPAPDHEKTFVLNQEETLREKAPHDFLRILDKFSRWLLQVFTGSATRQMLQRPSRWRMDHGRLDQRQPRSLRSGVEHESSTNPGRLSIQRGHDRRHGLSPKGGITPGPLDPPTLVCVLLTPLTSRTLCR